jgi:nickel superoxide dismutase
VDYYSLLINSETWDQSLFDDMKFGQLCETSVGFRNSPSQEEVMKSIFTLITVAVLFMAATAVNVAAHCEVPCGIYGDELRAKLIYEHSVTIEKSMTKITELSKQEPVNYNQLVRWISNKDAHANKIQHIIYQYFMTQRIRPDAAKYTEKLTVLHKMLQSAMKCKQGTDPSNVRSLRSLLKEFEMLYFGHSLN